MGQGVSDSLAYVQASPSFVRRSRKGQSIGSPSSLTNADPGSSFMHGGVVAPFPHDAQPISTIPKQAPLTTGNPLRQVCDVRSYWLHSFVFMATSAVENHRRMSRDGIRTA